MATVVCDLDGCLALVKDRSYYDGHLCATDEVNQAVAEVITALWDSGYDVIYLSGRSERARIPTNQWLAQNGLPDGDLLLRQPDDWRPAEVYKREMYEGAIKRIEGFKLALDDNPKVVAMFRELGVPAFQTSDYDGDPLPAVPVV
jgi:hypothetical protein